MDKFKIKKNRKFALLLIIAAVGLSLGGNLIGLPFGKSFSKLDAAEVDSQVAEKSSENSRSREPAKELNEENDELKGKEEVKLTYELKDDLKSSIDKTFREVSIWPDTLSIGKKKAKIEYTFNEQLDAYIKKTLKQYRSDFSTVTVVDNATGEVLAAVGLDGKNNSFDTKLVLSATHPSASLIKIITAAELIQNTKVSRETPFEFRGRSTTLFKYQLNDSKNNRWDKTQSFETAFAKSNNVIFGKAAIQNMDSSKLIKMAENFGFNKPLFQEFDFLTSQIHPTSDDYELAEIASGFNDQTVISPVHAATMASIIANKGIMKTPRLIHKLVDTKSGEVIWENNLVEKRVLTPEAAKEMHEMMGMTIDGGTARKSFRKMNTGYKNALEIGGKTGSITGGKPFGKRDWFAAYAIPRDPERGSGISISVMNVNVKRWHVKSTMLAKNIIEYYYNNIKPVPITMVKMPKLISERRYKKSRGNKRAIASSRLKKKPEARISKKKTSNIKRQIGKRNERKSITTL